MKIFFSTFAISHHIFFRKLKGPGVPTTVLKCAPEACDVHVVAKYKIITKTANPSSTTGMLEVLAFTSQ